MDDINRAVKYNSLLNIYQDLLSKTQKDILEKYFSYNLSISEIAEENNISRSAVEDAIKKGTKKLDDLENTLHIYKTRQKINEIANNVVDKNSVEELKELIKNIEKEINNGI